MVPPRQVIPGPRIEVTRQEDLANSGDRTYAPVSSVIESIFHVVC